MLTEYYSPSLERTDRLGDTSENVMKRHADIHTAQYASPRTLQETCVLAGGCAVRPTFVALTNALRMRIEVLPD